MLNQQQPWPPLSDAEQKAEKLATGTLIILWLVPFFYFILLPERIPIHFDGAGNPDGWGSRYLIFLLPGIGLAIHFFMGLISRQHDMMNFPVPRTPENEAALIQLTRLQLRYTKTLINILFTYLAWGMIQVGLEKMDNLPVWPIIFVVIIILGMSIYYYREAKIM
jgi:uncharacterized membrane protein